MTLYDRRSPSRRDDARHPSGASEDAASKTFSIAQLAKELGVTLRAIRFYESKGLIAPRRNGATRIYAHRDRVRLILILRGKRMGFSLKEIQQFLDLYSVDPTQVTQMRNLLNKVRDRIALLETQLRDVETSLGELREMERVTQGILAAKGVERRPSDDGLPGVERRPSDDGLPGVERRPSDDGLPGVE